MKQKIVTTLMAIILFVTIIGFTGCQQTNNEDTLTIYTSFYPIYDLTQKIVGEHAEVINLVKEGEEAHHYELTPQQVVALEEKADLLIVNGLDMEHFVEDLSQTVQDKLFVASDGLNILQIETELGQTRDDPHIWLSVKQAKLMLENIKNHIITLDATHQAQYERNYNRYALLLDGLDAQFEHAVESFIGTTFVVSHEAFSYIANDYGLTQIAMSGIDTDTEADPQTIATIIDFINTNNITTVFYQDAINATLATQIAEETSAKVDKLYTLENLTSAQKEQGEDYLSIMAANFAALIEALS